MVFPWFSHGFPIDLSIFLAMTRPRLIGFAITWPPYLDKRLDMYPTFDRILRHGAPWGAVRGAIGLGKDLEVRGSPSCDSI